MPIEFVLLANMPEPYDLCPKCGARFESFLRGMVQSQWRKFCKRPYCCIICSKCKDIIGYEYGE